MSENESGTRSLARCFAQDLPQEHAGLAPTLLRLADVVDSTTKEAGAIETSEELSEIGRKAARQRLASTVAKALESHEAALANLETTFGAEREKATRFPAGEDTPAAAMRQREIRDRLAGLGPMLVAIKYYNAIERGDWETVRAVESAPQAFSLIDEDTRARGIETRLAGSPAAPKLAALKDAINKYRLLLGSAKGDLRRLAERHR
jgi:hypothetical protein